MRWVTTHWPRMGQARGLIKLVELRSTGMQASALLHPCRPHATPCVYSARSLTFPAPHHQAHPRHTPPLVALARTRCPCTLCCASTLPSSFAHHAQVSDDADGSSDDNSDGDLVSDDDDASSGDDSDSDGSDANSANDDSDDNDGSSGDDSEVGPPASSPTPPGVRGLAQCESGTASCAHPGWQSANLGGTLNITGLVLGAERAKGGHLTHTRVRAQLCAA